MALLLLCIDGMEEKGSSLPAFPTAHLAGHGRVTTAPTGAPIDSLGCILRLLGTRETNLPRGRAVVEALAVGVPVGQNDLAFRCTLCAVDQNGRLAPAPENMDVGRLLSRILLPNGWSLHSMSDYRCLLRIKDGASVESGLVTLPPHQYFGKPLANVLPYGSALGASLADFVRQSVRRLPGYALIPWGQSVPHVLSPLRVPAVMVCAAEIVRGIGLLLGMHCPPIAGATADVDTNLIAKRQAVLDFAGRYPLVVVHVNGCDEAAHRRNSAQKITFINRIIAELVEPLHSTLKEGDRLLICSDHWTSSQSGGHEAGRVHYWLYEPYAQSCEMVDFNDPGTPLRRLLGEEDG